MTTQLTDNPSPVTRDFFVIGGTMPADSPSYIERRADTELYESLKRGELSYVLNARQMGKSSLCVRVRSKLQNDAIKTVFLDLQKFGSSANPEQWYATLLAEIGRSVNLRKEVLVYWKENTLLTPLARLFSALREVILEQTENTFVLFIDEIDVVRDMAFSTDEFFAAIRQCYNARTDDPVYNRVTFCILGTVAPTDLIRDVRLSPFNIGTRIKMADFTTTEAMPLATPLPGGAKTLERVLWWTNGHPYLTQRVCAELVHSASDDVDAMVARLFFSKVDADVDDNIKNVRNGILTMADAAAGYDRTDLLNRYDEILLGKSVPDDDTDSVCTALRLMGIVRSSGGLLSVRNRVYKQIFNRSWVRDNLPDGEVRRQRAAVLKARWQVGAIASVVLLVMGFLTFWAMQNATRARSAVVAERKARNEANAQQQKAIASADAERAARDEAQRQAKAATEARQKAEVALTGEKRAKTAAQQSALTAQASTRQAEQNATLARDEKQRAEAQTRLAQTTAEEATRLAYIASVNQAQRAQDENRLSDAHGYLNDMHRLLRQSNTMKSGAEIPFLEDRMQTGVVTLRGHEQTVTSVCFSPDGKKALTGSYDNSAILWDVASGKKIRTFKGHSNWVYSVSFSPSGNQILTGSCDNTVKLWDVLSGREIRTFRGCTDWVYSVCFSPDGKQVLAASENTARLWDVATGREVRTFDGHTNLVSSACFSPDGKTILTASYDRTAKLWDVATGEEIETFAGHTSTIYSVCFSPNGEQILTGSWDNTAKIWDVASGMEIQTFKGHSKWVYSVCFSPDGKQAVTGSYDNTAKIWDVATGRVIRTLVGHRSWVTSVSFSSDGRHVLTGSYDETAKLWDVVTGRTLVLATSAISTCFSPDGRQVLTGGYEQTAKLWDIATGRLIRRFKDHTKTVASVCFSPDGKQILTGSYDGTAKLWEVMTGKKIVTLRDVGPIDSVCFSPDGRLICTASSYSTRGVKLWDAATGKKIRTLTGQGVYVSSPCFSPNGQQILTGNGYYKTATLWDVETGRNIRTFKGHYDSVNSVCFSPDGTKMLTGSADRTAKLWDIATGRIIRTFKGHISEVTTSCFSPDGRQILTGSMDRTAKLWDLDSGRELLTLKAHTEAVTAVCFSPDGKQILTGSRDDTARIWRRMTNTQVNEVVRRNTQASLSTTLQQMGLESVLAATERLLASKKQNISFRHQIADVLNTIAWRIVDPNKEKPTPYKATLALRIAERAVELTGNSDGLILDTLAAARFACGDLAGALEAQRKAVRLEPADENLRTALKRYEKLRTETAP